MAGKFIARITIVVFHLFLTTSIFSQEKMLFAIDVIRHGDRMPLNQFPTPKNWKLPLGRGQLTGLGMRQAYELGKKKRTLYILQNHLLPAHFEDGTLYARSSAYERTIMSAQAFLLGLYPLGSGPQLPNHQPALPAGFQPIPVFTVSSLQDNLIVQVPHLKQYRNLVRRYEDQSKEWVQKRAELQNKIPVWSKLSGIKITSLNALIPLGNTLFIYKLKNYPIPAGLSNAESNRIINLGNWVFATTFENKLISRLAGYQLLKNINQYLQTTHQSNKKLKYVLFSAHDYTILALMRLMQAPLKVVPGYASDLNFILYKNNSGYVVKIKYNDKPVFIKACGGNSCTLKQFSQIVLNA